ncbi:hypothetical protein RND81_09G071000 [Saponaria officinalis]|uniref:Uncharacterized protein n=1 Tax=Saponaria officinalis TaxID=3572 RepID=A0AAW1IHQ5_SAPOF
MDDDDAIVNSLLEEDNNEIIVISTETQMSGEGGEKKKVVIPRIFMKNDVSYALIDDFDVTGSLVGMKVEKWEHLQTVYKRHSQISTISLQNVSMCQKRGLFWTKRTPQPMKQFTHYPQVQMLNAPRLRQLRLPIQS